MQPGAVLKVAAIVASGVLGSRDEGNRLRAVTALTNIAKTQSSLTAGDSEVDDRRKHMRETSAELIAAIQKRKRDAA